MPNRKIGIRVFNNFTDNINHKIIIFFHGGGWVTGNLNSYTTYLKQLSISTNRIIIAVDYRLAPEFKFPKGLDDCYDICKLIIQNYDKFNIEQRDIIIMGDSAGGNLCAAISLKSNETQEFKIDKQILLYPCLQCDYSINSKYKSVNDKNKIGVLTRKQLCEYIQLYVKNNDDLKNKYLNILQETDFKNHPSTLIITSEIDLLLDEGIDYAKKLKQFKNNVYLYTFKGAMHGFISNPLEKEYNKRSIEKIKKFIGVKNE